jgi:hypothetical protein
MLIKNNLDTRLHLDFYKGGAYIDAGETKSFPVEITYFDKFKELEESPTITVVSYDEGTDFRPVIRDELENTNNWGVEAGGGLSGFYPNPTVTDDGHNHTSDTLPVEILDITYESSFPIILHTTGLLTSITLTIGTPFNSTMFSIGTDENNSLVAADILGNTSTHIIVGKELDNIKLYKVGTPTAGAAKLIVKQI